MNTRTLPEPVETREAALFAARAIVRKHRIRDDAELLTMLDNLVASTDCMHSTTLDEYRERLIELCMDLEDEIGAHNHPRCPPLSAKRLSRVTA